MCVAGGSAVAELRRALEEYLSLIIGLTKKGIRVFYFFYICNISLMSSFESSELCVYLVENGLEDSVEFKWKNLEDGQHVRLSKVTLLQYP